MARTDKAFNLRIPPELKEKLESQVKASGRTMTSEIISRLECSLSESSDEELKKIREICEDIQEKQDVVLKHLKGDKECD
jgi:predicted DNA-binding protein